MQHAQSRLMLVPRRYHAPLNVEAVDRQLRAWKISDALKGFAIYTGVVALGIAVYGGIAWLLAR